MPHIEVKEANPAPGQESFAQSYPGLGLYRIPQGLALVYAYQPGAAACVFVLYGDGGLKVEDSPPAANASQGVDVHRFLDQIIQLRK